MLHFSLLLLRRGVRPMDLLRRVFSLCLAAQAANFALEGVWILATRDAFRAEFREHLCRVCGTVPYMLLSLVLCHTLFVMMALFTSLFDKRLLQILGVSNGVGFSAALAVTVFLWWSRFQSDVEYYVALGACLGSSVALLYTVWFVWRLLEEEGSCGERGCRVGLLVLALPVGTILYGSYKGGLVLGGWLGFVTVVVHVLSVWRGFRA